MGLDIYAGTLTRYYSNNWKTVAQQWAEENGYEFQFVNRDGEVVDRGQNMTTEEIKEVIENWRDQVCESIMHEQSPFKPWTEHLDKPYYTDKPDWTAYGALLLCAACTALREPIPEFIEKSWNFEEDSLIQKTMVESLLTSSLLTGVMWWLPIKESYSFRFSAPTGENIRIGTTGFLLEELRFLNDKLWQASEDEIVRWSREEGYPVDGVADLNGKIELSQDHQRYNTQSLAKLAFSIMWQAAAFSMKEQVPVILDPWQEMQERIESALIDLQNQAIVSSQKEEHEHALKILHGLEKFLSKREQSFSCQCVYYTLGIIYNILDDMKNAFLYTQLSIDTEQYKGDAYTLMGTLHKNQKSYPASVESFKNALLCQYLSGPEVFDEFEAGSVWHYMAIAMLYAYEENQYYDPIRILRVLQEVILIDPEYYLAYQNISVCFKALAEKSFLKLFSKEQKLAKEFAKIAASKSLDDVRYWKLLDILTEYTRDDDYPYLHFSIYLDGQRAKVEIKPSFQQIKKLIQELWNETGDFQKIKLKNAFGAAENALTISCKKEVETQKTFMEFKSDTARRLILRQANLPEGAGEDDIARFVYNAYDKEEAIAILERHFYYHQLKDYTRWIPYEEYAKKEVEEVKKSLQPKVFEPFFNKTAVPFNEIILKKQRCDHFDSKVGGEPYMPVGVSWPLSAGGTPLRLLAQINFEQMPPLPDFPTTGILQFFILENDVNEPDFMYGLDFDDPTSQSGFRVIYHECVNRNTPQQPPPALCFHPGDALLEKEDCLKITYQSEKMAMTSDDYRFDEIFPAVYNEGVSFGQKIERFFDLDNSISEAVFDAFFRDGHRISGYPYFTQTDPRDDGDDKDILLFQLDSDEVEDVSFMWGDAGVANFFISKENLRNRNFTDVLYNWDCG